MDVLEIEVADERISRTRIRNDNYNETNIRTNSCDTEKGGGGGGGGDDRNRNGSPQKSNSRIGRGYGNNTNNHYADNGNGDTLGILHFTSGGNSKCGSTVILILAVCALCICNFLWWMPRHHVSMYKAQTTTTTMTTALTAPSTTTETIEQQNLSTNSIDTITSPNSQNHIQQKVSKPQQLLRPKTTATKPRVANQQTNRTHEIQNELREIRKTEMSKKHTIFERNQQKERKEILEKELEEIRKKVSGRRRPRRRRPLYASSKDMTFPEDTSKPFPIALCLLIKDDNPSLSEFIAWHYHTMHLRRVIVAVDPDSETTPADVLEPWSKHFGLEYTIWHDSHYMPGDFLDGTEKLPSVLTSKDYTFNNVTNTTTSRYFSRTNPRTGQEYTQQEILDGLEKINNHRVRQLRFVSQCYRRLKDENYTWTLHIDTDEYIVPNPHLLKHREIVEQTKPDLQNAPEADFLGSDTTSDPTGIVVPKRPTEDSLQIFMRSMMTHFASRHQMKFRNCLKIPRLLFGSKEDEEIQQRQALESLNRTRTSTKSTSYDDMTRREQTSSRHFNTQRWTYSAETDERYNGYPKSILNVAMIPDDNYIFKEPRWIESVHNPIREEGVEECACYEGYFPYLPSEKDVESAVKAWKEEADSITLPGGLLDRPLIANHYLGSFEDYMARNDPRRTRRDYKSKAQNGNSRKDSGWMSSWIEDFLELHGMEKVKVVLRHHDLSSLAAKANH